MKTGNYSNPSRKMMLDARKLLQNEISLERKRPVKHPKAAAPDTEPPEPHIAHVSLLPVPVLTLRNLNLIAAHQTAIVALDILLGF